VVADRPLADAGNGVFAVFLAGESSAHFLNLGAERLLDKPLSLRR